MENDILLVLGFALAVHIFMLVRKRVTLNKVSRMLLLLESQQFAASAEVRMGCAEMLFDLVPNGDNSRKTLSRFNLRAFGSNETLAVESIGVDYRTPVPLVSTLADETKGFAEVRFVDEPEVSYDALVVGAMFEVVVEAHAIGTGRVTQRGVIRSYIGRR